MDTHLPPDHESDVRRRFDEQRLVFLRLAHEQTLMANSERLLEQIRHTEALQRLRAKWHATGDPSDLGQTETAPPG